LECLFCKSKNVEALMDKRVPKIKDNLWGVIRCKSCNNVGFFIAKSKEKIKIGDSGNIEVTSVPKIKYFKYWTDDIITPWLYEIMQESCQKTGRSIETCYQGIKIEGSIGFTQEFKDGYLKKYGVKLKGREVRFND
jgi:hypothetical protein